MIDKRKLENILFFVSLFFVILGAIGFTRGFYISMTTSTPGLTYSRLPLGDLEGIAVDDTGNIYCASPFYSRVQVYDIKGRFIYGLKIPANGGSFSIDIDEAQNLLVQTARNNMLYVFNQSGKLIQQKETKAEYDIFKSRLEFIDNYNNRYLIKNRFLFPHITIITPDGKVKTVVSNSLLDWFLSGPLPSWLFFAVGFLTIFIILGVPSELADAQKKRRESRRTKKPIIEV